MIRAMLDFETLGTSPNAMVIQAGVCIFNLAGDISGSLLFNIKDPKGVMEKDTVMWWLKQRKEAQESLFTEPVDAHWAFTQLNQYLANVHEIWSHATFDFVILCETLKMFNIKPAFSYKASRDIRTLTNIFKVDTGVVFRDGVHHNALDDAIHQARYCSYIMRQYPEVFKE